MALDTLKICDTIFSKVTNLTYIRDTVYVKSPPTPRTFDEFFFSKYKDWIKYISLIFLMTLLLRLAFSMMRALEEKYRDINVGDGGKSKKLIAKELAFFEVPYWQKLRIILGGGSKQDPHPDLWYNTAIGTVELFIFPFFLQSEQYTIIGAWIGYKVVASWNVWQTNRLKFVSFQLGNLIVLILTYLIMLIVLRFNHLNMMLYCVIIIAFISFCLLFFLTPIFKKEASSKI